jgi:hypothetical protein
MYTERDAIELRLREIGEERRALNDERTRLLDRLHTLDTRDATQLQAEGGSINVLVRELSNAVQRLSDLIPTISVQDVIDDVKQKNEAAAHVIIEETQQEAPVKTAVRRAAQKSNSAKPTQKKGRLTPRERVIPKILEIIREAPQPIAPKDIAEKLRKEEMVIGGIYQYLQDVSKDDRITQPERGKYAYVDNNEVAAAAGE